MSSFAWVFIIKRTRFQMIVNMISVIDNFSVFQFVSGVFRGYELCEKKINGRCKTLWDSVMVYCGIKVWCREWKIRGWGKRAWDFMMVYQGIRVWCPKLLDYLRLEFTIWQVEYRITVVPMGTHQLIVIGRGWFKNVNCIERKRVVWQLPSRVGGCTCPWWIVEHEFNERNRVLA